MTKREMKNKILSALSLGVIFQWLSLFFSYKRLPNAFELEDINQPIATSGFPLKIFEYPVHPMGGDWPPADTWPAFFLNLAIWVAIAFLIVFVFRKRFEMKKIAYTLCGVAFLLTLIGFGYLVLLFD